MKSEMKIEFDKSLRDFQAALTLSEDLSMMESALDRLWNKYIDSVSSKLKLFLCFMSHSALGYSFRDFPCFRSISYLIKKEIPSTLLLKYFAYPWRNEELSSLFIHLPAQVALDYIHLCLPLKKPIHPLLFRELRKENLSSTACNSDALLTTLTAYSKNELIELIFYITAEFNASLIYTYNDPTSELFPVASDTFHNHESNDLLNTLASHINDVWEMSDSNIDSDALMLHWPYPGVEGPKTKTAHIQHYAHCIVTSRHCPKSLKSRLSSMAKKYEKNDTLSFEDLLECSGASEWTCLWNQVFERNELMSGIAQMRHSKNLRLEPWTLRPLFALFKDNSHSSDLKYLIIETFKLLTIPDKVIFLEKFLQDNNSETLILGRDTFLEDVKVFMNKAGDDDFINTQHDALVLAVSHPRQFLDVLLSEVFSGGHKAFLSILIESLFILLFHNETHLKETLVNALLNSSCEKFPENLASVKEIISTNPMKNFDLNLVNTSYNLFSASKHEKTYRLISALKYLGEHLSINESPDIFETLLIIYKDINSQSSLSLSTSRIQEVILEIARDYANSYEEFEKELSNPLHQRLRHCYLAKKESEQLESLADYFLVEGLVPVLPKATPSEWNILFSKLSSADIDKMKNVFKALSMIALHGAYDLYLFRQASLEISSFSNRNKCNPYVLLELLKSFCKFLWIVQDRSDIISVFDICLTSLINHVTEGSVKDEATLKSICVFLNFIPNCSGKRIAIQKMGQTIGQFLST